MNKLRIFEIAALAAQESELVYKHGAALVKGGSIIKIGCNKGRFINWGKKFSMHPSLHAELSVLLNMKKEVTKGLDLYVCRIKKDMTYAESKPCHMCTAIAKEMGIKRVWYTTDNGQIGKLVL